MGKRKTYEEVKQIFEDGNCTLLSTNYVNTVTKLKYLCECGEEKEISLTHFKQGQRCRECGIKNRKDPQKYSLTQVENIFSEKDCTLLSDEYINNKTKLQFICRCGRQGEKVLSEFLESSQCKQCGIEVSTSSRRHSYKTVKGMFEEAGCTLISSEYKNNRTKLHYRCKCGEEAHATLDLFLRERRCVDCYEKERIKYTREYVQFLVESKDCEYISQEMEHKYTRISFICTCGENGSVLLMSFISGARCATCSKESFRRNNSGANNANWNPDITEEERKIKRNYLEYSEWRQDVYKRDNYKCQCCGTGGEIHAHHKDGYHWCKDRRTDVTNGVTLCKQHHIEFHSIYGNKNNTEDQYIEFENYNKNKLLNLK